MFRLPHWARIVSALTAAEMVLPIWEENELINEKLSEEQMEAPRRAIEITWQSLDNNAAAAEVPTTAAAATDAACCANVYTAPAAYSVYSAARAAAEAAWAVRNGYRWSIRGIRSAASALRGAPYLVLVTLTHGSMRSGGTFVAVGWRLFWKLASFNIAHIRK